MVDVLRMIGKNQVFRRSDHCYRERVEQSHDNLHCCHAMAASEAVVVDRVWMILHKLSAPKSRY